MSKQDRQGVRRPAEIERKYGLGQTFATLGKATASNANQLVLQEQNFKQYVQSNNANVDNLGEKDKELEATDESLQSQVNTLFQLLDDIYADLSQDIGNYWETVYPVGSIYVSISATSPATLFGGKWERIQDRFLLAAGSTYAADSTGGEAEHTLTIEEMPVHSHKYYYPGHTSGSDWYGQSGTAKGDQVNSTTSGGGQAHNNMPPYLAVYVWKRTA